MNGDGRDGRDSRVSIESNIHVGGGILCNHIKQYFNIDMEKEPLYNWKYNELLDNFFKDMRRWGLLVLMRSIYEKHNKILKQTYRQRNIFFSERSIQSDKYVLLNTLRELELIDATEYSLATDIFDNFNRNGPIYRYIVYLRCPQFYGENYTVRGSQVPQLFFTTIENHLEQWIYSQKESTVIVIDIREPLTNSTDKQILDNICEKLITWIPELKFCISRRNFV